jgi:hypothetical protein
MDTDIECSSKYSSFLRILTIQANESGLLNIASTDLLLTADIEVKSRSQPFLASLKIFC